MNTQAVITGVGMVTPLGVAPDEVVRRIQTGESAATPTPSSDGIPPACPFQARISDFDAESFVPEPKTIRLMSRDALLAVAAARLALGDAGVQAGRECPADAIGLYGATGLAGVPLGEVSRLIESSADEQGRLDLRQFGEVALKQVRPVLSFKILSNMPLCFVSIFTGIQGPNAIFNPWEGQGAHAIAAAVDAIRQGEVPCALAGGCDVKTHDLGRIALRQWGVLDSWQLSGSGCIPGEGAVFLVLEAAERAAKRGARVYGRIRSVHCATIRSEPRRVEAYEQLLRQADCGGATGGVAAGDGDSAPRGAGQLALGHMGLGKQPTIYPKKHAGNLFAAAAALQVGVAAVLAQRASTNQTVLANCFGYGSEQALFVLEAP
jgi:3-oxoacyl-[acyl-carrier-protein] synthase II